MLPPLRLLYSTPSTYCRIAGVDFPVNYGTTEITIRSIVVRSTAGVCTRNRDIFVSSTGTWNKKERTTYWRKSFFDQDVPVRLFACPRFRLREENCSELRTKYWDGRVPVFC